LKRDVIIKNINVVLPQVYSPLDTLKLLQQGFSIARFGDGELSLVLGDSLCFQKYNKVLANKLRCILQNNHECKCLVSIMPAGDCGFSDIFYRKRSSIIKFLNFEKPYANTLVTRAFSLQTIPKEEYRKIWNNRKVVFVYSSRGRFYIEAALFSNISLYEVIDIPPKNAFSEYDRIFNEAKQYPLDWLFLIAAGPTATVLAFELSVLGYQAIDIGHLPNCYLEALGLNTAPEKLPVSHKLK
jgi:hypothetical protein